MAEQDFSKRLVIIVRKDLPAWQAANTVAHISAYIGYKLGGSFGTGEFFVTADKKDFPRNSQYPFIIKKANSNEQLHNVLLQAREHKILYHAFIREMIETTDDIERENILDSKPESGVELLGLGVFGPHEEVNLLTKKFSLWD